VDPDFEESTTTCRFLKGDFGDVIDDVSSIERDKVVIGGGCNVDWEVVDDIDEHNIISSSSILVSSLL